MYYPDYFIDHPDYSIQVDHQFESGPDMYLMWFTKHHTDTVPSDDHLPSRMPTQWQPACDT